MAAFLRGSELARFSLLPAFCIFLFAQILGGTYFFSALSSRSVPANGTCSQRVKSRCRYDKLWLEGFLSGGTGREEMRNTTS